MNNKQWYETIFREICDSEVRVLAVGCDEYLAKPVELKKLIELIDKYIV